MINNYYREIKLSGDFKKISKQAETVKGNRTGESGLTPVNKKNELTLHAWRMNPGDISEPFTWSGGGFSVIQLIEKKAGRQLSFDEVRDQVFNDLYEYQRKNNMNLWLAKLKDRYKVTLYEKNLTDIYEVTIQ
jgi:hypothetical protein